MSYDNVIRVLYRGAWHSSKGEAEWSYRFTRAGIEYTLHPKVAYQFHCRPDFRLSTGVIVDYKPNVSDYYGEFQVGNIPNLIEVSRVNKGSLAFVGAIPYRFSGYDDFMEQIKAAAACKTDSGFHTFSFYANGEKEDGAYVPMFLCNGGIRFAEVGCSESFLTEKGFDIKKTLSIYSEHPDDSIWSDTTQGNAPELKTKMNKEKLMEYDSRLIWNEPDDSFSEIRSNPYEWLI